VLARHLNTGKCECHYILFCVPSLRKAHRWNTSHTLSKPWTSFLLWFNTCSTRVSLMWVFMPKMEILLLRYSTRSICWVRIIHTCHPRRFTDRIWSFCRCRICMQSLSSLSSWLYFEYRSMTTFWCSISRSSLSGSRDGVTPLLSTWC
jgi:hypothetical protein